MLFTNYFKLKMIYTSALRLSSNSYEYSRVGVCIAAAILRNDCQRESRVV